MTFLPIAFYFLNFVGKCFLHFVVIFRETKPMEDSTSLFSLSIDPVAKTHLLETAKWARFLAMVGFVFIFLFIIIGIISSIALSRYSDIYDGGSSQRGFANAIGMGTAFSYIIMSVIAFFPLMFMLRFANNMKRAIQTDDQELLNNSFQNLKVYFRYIGIITIIALVLMLLSVFIAIAGRTI